MHLIKVINPAGRVLDHYGAFDGAPTNLPNYQPELCPTVIYSTLLNELYTSINFRQCIFVLFKLFQSKNTQEASFNIKLKTKIESYSFNNQTLKTTCFKNILLTLTLISLSLGEQKMQTKQELINTIEMVNNYWQSTHTDPGNPFWDNAVYHTGNMEAYFVTGDEAFRQYSEKWEQKK